MPLSHQIYIKEATAVVKAVGTIDVQDSIKAMKALIDDQDFNSHFNVIVDLRQIKYTPNPTDSFRIKDSLNILKTHFLGEITVLSDIKLLPIIKMTTAMAKVYGLNIVAVTESKLLDELESRTI